ncbi:PAS domain S-box protein [Autumnicola psychrophila]|uniref:histidine kinase n=1 Tax=Autumnicola psychrophila TaxID=3075592 RepID=A0ABU3DU77_9FLAO|nr:PAS domain S-box protein [Zunongwangia sp. F225]MDT0687270.1 PAS domain S-box protein [Zunongwangia sp. F225]
MDKKLKIIHLENSSGDAELVAEALKAGGFDPDISIVQTAEEFLPVLETCKPDIILSEYSTPSFHAKTAIKLLQDSNIIVPFLLVTHGVSDECAVDLLKNGADDYILKDRVQRLPGAVETVLEKFRCEEEREKYIRELEYNQNKFKSLIENGADGVLILTPQGETTYASPSIESILGYTIEEAMQIRTLDISHEDDKEDAVRNMRACLENPGRPVKAAVVRIKHKDGSWHWLEATLTNMLDNPAVKGIVNNFRDISQRKEANNSIKESEEKYRAFFKTTADGILLTEPSGKIHAANPAACRIFKMTEEEICKAGRSGVTDGTDPRLAAAIKERELTGSAHSEITMLRKGGIKFPAELTSAVFTDASGEEKMSVIIRDISDRKKTEEEIKASKENYRLLFQFSPLPSLIYDQESLAILDVNQAAIKHYGYNRDEFISMSILDLRPQEHVPAFLSFLKKELTKEEVMGSKSSVHLKKDQTRIKVAVWAYSLMFKKRKCILSVLQDVTEREEVFERLKEEESKLRLAQEIGKIGYWEVNFQNNTFYWSDEVYNIWGRKKENFQVGQEEFLKTIHPEDIEEFKQHQLEAISGSKDLDYEHRIILPDGNVKWIHEKGKTIKDENGENFMFKGSIQDITERKENLNRLMRSEARHHGILKSQTNYLIRTDLEGYFTYVNEKFQNDFKWIHSEDPVGKSALTSVYKEHHERVTEGFKAAIQNPNEVFQVEIDKLQENGRLKTTLWDFVCLTGADGEPIEVQCVGIDITDRVKAERSLKESNIRYELVTRATSDAIWDWNLETGYMLWGESFQILFGYSRDAVFPDVDFWKDRIHPEDALRVIGSIYAAQKGGETNWQEEYRFRKSDGDYACVIDRGFIIRNKAKKAIRMVGAIQDITEKKKLRDLLDSASRLAKIGSYEINLKENSLYWSSIIKEIHDLPKDFTPDFNDAVRFIKPGKDRSTFVKTLGRAVDKNDSFELDLQIITAKNNERWIRIIGKPEFENGVCICVNGSFQDIDKMKRAEIEVLKASEEKEMILESIGDAFFALDQNREVTYWNLEAERLLRRSKDEVVGKNLSEVFGDKFSQFKEYFERAVAESTTQHFEAFFEDIRSWFEVNAYPAPKKGLSVYLKDVTDRKEANLQLMELNRSLKSYTEELVSANKGLEQFSYIVSHNLRAPLANILGLADLLSDEEYGQHVKQNFLNELLNNVERLDHVIKDLNDILQVKVSFDAKKESVNLQSMVSSVEASIKNLMQLEKVQIETEFYVPEVKTIQSYLYSIFYNLIANSIKYRQAELPPEIRIKSEKKGSHVVITFMDNGLGIDLTTKRDQIFGLYKRFHQHVEGKGMGLFMVKTQVEMLGGKITIDSEVNKGTVFELEFDGF